MTSQTLPGERPEIRVIVYAFALIFPPLLAFNRTPSATQLNELLCVLGWGLCLLAANRMTPGSGRRGATTMLMLALGAMCIAVVASWTIGSLPTSLALPPLLLLVVACFVVTLGARVAQGGDRDGLRAFEPFAIGMLVVGLFSTVIAVIQVFYPDLARLGGGNFIAESTIPGRAVGNLRQPNHLASLLIWSAIALVPLVEWRRIPRWLGGLLLLFIMYGVFLSGSRTGLLGGAVVLVAWAVCDWNLSASTRIALVVAVALALAMPWLSTHFSHASIGTATRASDGDSSHFAIWKNAVEMVRQQPWLGVGWGEFNFAWTLTPFPHRPTAFFDHTHDLPLQLIVELGLPLGLLVLGLLVWALVQGLVRVMRTQGDAAHGARAAWVMVIMIGVHSLDEYPLWYAYFLLPAAWAWGFTLGSGPAPKPAAEPALSGVGGVGGVGGGRPVDPGKLVRLGSEGSALRWFGATMVAVALLSTWDYWRVSTIFIDDAGLAPLSDRIAAGEASPFFAHHADYADATIADPPSKALGAFERATHSLLDSRLMMAWATALAESGQTDRARYLVARLKEFDKTDTVEFFAPCSDATLQVKPFQCLPEPKGLTWRDFR